MKYFTLAGVALLGFVAAAPAWDINAEYEVDEDCIDESFDVQAAEMYDDSYVVGYEVDPECDDEPIPETSILEFEPVFIEPSVFVDETYVDPIYEEECVDEEPQTTDLTPTYAPETTNPPVTDYPDCDGDYTDSEPFDEIVEDIGGYGIYDNVLYEADAAYDLDDIILEHTLYENEGNASPIEECDE